EPGAQVRIRGLRPPWPVHKLVELDERDTQSLGKLAAERRLAVAARDHHDLSHLQAASYSPIRPTGTHRAEADHRGSRTTEPSTRRTCAPSASAQARRSATRTA